MESIKLKYEDQIKTIENCPSDANYDGNIVLYRCVGNPITDESFIPHALLKEKFKRDCNCWGLSTYNDVKSAKKRLKSLSKAISVKYSSIAQCLVTNDDGVKYQSYGDRAHFTFFPNEDFDCVAKFNLINGDE